MDTELRNPTLYRRLCQLYTKSGVKLHNPGVATGFIKQEQRGQTGLKYMLKRTDNNIGEQYSINCPFCHDNEKRLHIHHYYGSPDGARNFGYTQLWHCFNEECQAEYENRQKFKSIIAGDDGLITLVDQSVSVIQNQVVVDIPGQTISFDYLLQHQPSHRAIQWSLIRGLPVRDMAKLGFEYCVEGGAQSRRCTGRIIVPFFARTTDEVMYLKGWSARRIVDDDSPKWLHSTAPTGDIVYGLAGAAQCRNLVITEGPFDKLVGGTNAVAILGKSLSDEKASRIAKAMHRTGEDDRSIILLLDPDQDADSLSKGRLHHMEKSLQTMQRHTTIKCIAVYLPKGTDPGSLCPNYLWSYILREAWRQGVAVDRKKRVDDVPKTNSTQQCHTTTG